jgi:hypothetical protein
MPTRSPTGRELRTLDTNEIICIRLHDHAPGLRQPIIRVNSFARFLLLSESGVRGREVLGREVQGAARLLGRGVPGRGSRGARVAGCPGRGVPGAAAVAVAVAKTGVMWQVSPSRFLLLSALDQLCLGEKTFTGAVAGIITATAPVGLGPGLVGRGRRLGGGALWPLGQPGDVGLASEAGRVMRGSTRAGSGAWRWGAGAPGSGGRRGAGEGRGASDTQEHTRRDPDWAGAGWRRGASETASRLSDPLCGSKVSEYD